MLKYAYEARTDEGELTAGMVTAESPEQAGQLLSQRNLFVVRMAVDGAPSRRAVVKGHATRAEVVWQMSQLSVMVETGIRLSDALDCLARQASRPRLKVLLEQVSKSVQEGRSLSESMEMFPRSFNPSLVALIRASEMSGTMSRVLQRSAGYLMNDLQAIRRMRAALLYPAFMFLASLGVTIFLLTVILPRFASIFAMRNAVLPLPTRMLMNLSDSLLINWSLWLAGAIGLGAAGFVWLRSSIGRRQIDSLLITVPVLSRVFTTLYQSRTFRTLAVMLETGVPLVDVMKVIQDLVPNGHYRELWRRVDEEIRRGERMAGPLLASHLIAEPVAQMIDSGDRSGKLGLVFSRLADFMEEECNQATKSAMQFIEPCMILLMGAIIGFIAAALMLPLFQASRIVAS